MSTNGDHALRADGFGQRVVETASAVALAAAVIYLAAVSAGYVEVHPRPLYVVLIPLAAVAGVSIAKYLTSRRRPEVFYFAAVAGAVAALVSTSIAIWLTTRAHELGTSSVRAASKRQFAVGVGDAKAAVEHLAWSRNMVPIAVCALVFLVVTVAATMLSPAGRRVVRDGSIDRVPLAAMVASGLTVVVCGWLLYRL